MGPSLPVIRRRRLPVPRCSSHSPVLEAVTDVSMDELDNSYEFPDDYLPASQ